MAKRSGLGMQFYVDGVDVSGDINSIKRISGGPAPWETTGINKEAKERIGLKRDGGIEFTSYFNPAAGQAHATFKTLPTTDRIISALIGTTLGNPIASLVGKQIKYDPKREDSGAFTLDVESLANSFGLEWGVQGTAGKRTDGSATNGTAVDLASVSPGAFGLSMYVHLFAFTGTSVTIKLQESSDNGSGDAFADVVGATTGALTTAPQGLRVATGAINVERYVRVATTGTFSNAVFTVQFARHATAVTF